MIGRQVLVSQRLARRYPLLGVKDEHALQEVDRWAGGQ